MVSKTTTVVMIECGHLPVKRGPAAGTWEIPETRAMGSTGEACGFAGAVMADCFSILWPMAPASMRGWGRHRERSESISGVGWFSLRGDIPPQAQACERHPAVRFPGFGRDTRRREARLISDRHPRNLSLPPLRYILWHDESIDRCPRRLPDEAPKASRHAGLGIGRTGQG